MASIVDINFNVLLVLKYVGFANKNQIYSKDKASPRHGEACEGMFFTCWNCTWLHSLSITTGLNMQKFDYVHYTGHKDVYIVLQIYQ